MVAQIEIRLKDKDMGIELTPAAKTLIAQRGYDPDARCSAAAPRPAARHRGHPGREDPVLRAEVRARSWWSTWPIRVRSIPFTFTGNPRSKAPDAPPVEFGGIVEGFGEGPAEPPAGELR